MSSFLSYGPYNPIFETTYIDWLWEGDDVTLKEPRDPVCPCGSVMSWDGEIEVWQCPRCGACAPDTETRIGATS